MDNLRHSAAHLLAAAVLETFPKAKHTIGPVIENGFYYDFDLGDKKISEEDFMKLEKIMKALVKDWKSFESEEVSAKKAKEIFKGNECKLELIEELEKENEKITIYKSGDFVDLCRGEHTKNPSKDIKHFKLLSVAGAYWRGDEKNKMLTRIYGTAFESQKELDLYLKNIEEAKKRDHRKIGKELDLFHLDQTVGLGLPLWHPKGAMLWRIIEDFWYKEHLKSGYELVRSPHVGSKDLWVTSGHWDFYNKSMYPPMDASHSLEEIQEGKDKRGHEQYLLKPMNCPFHVQIYKNGIRSYKELPLRWAECGTVYRFEKKGELSGLTRVRGFTQDDAHIFCIKEQVEEELGRVIDFIIHIYKSFGFPMESVFVYLSLRDKSAKKKFTGSDEGWQFTEKVLEKVAKQKGLNYEKEMGEAAFYGPKLDFKIKDSLGRLWQCSTLQFDFNLPQRFDMTFINERGEKEKPYMLHRALFGSYERFIGLLLEHYAGSLPAWLNPVQAKILPITDRNMKYAKQILGSLVENDIRAEIDDRSETLGAKIRDAQKQKVSYMLIVGDKEEKEKLISVRARYGKDHGKQKISKFVSDIKKEIKERKNE